MDHAFRPLVMVSALFSLQSFDTDGSRMTSETNPLIPEVQFRIAEWRRKNLQGKTDPGSPGKLLFNRSHE